VSVNPDGRAVFDLPRGHWIAFPANESPGSEDESFVELDPDGEIAHLMRERTRALRERRSADAREIEERVRELVLKQRRGSDDAPSGTTRLCDPQ
jgi:hypothetical protein